jgi:small subunit ribosomal protein S3Ae
MVVAKKVSKKIRKKQWFQVLAPKLLNNEVLGHINLYDAADSIGRNVRINLMNLTKDIKSQNVKINFIINKVSGDNLYADLEGYDMIQASIRRMVRRDTSKIDASFVAETNDRKKIRVKFILITKNKVKSSVQSKLRKTAEDIIGKNFKKMTYENIFQIMANHKFQSNLKKVLNKIYPLKVCEVRSMHIEKEAKAKGLSAEIIKKEIEAKSVKEKEEAKLEEKAEAKKPKEKKAKPKKAEEKAEAKEEEKAPEIPEEGKTAENK